MSQAAFGDGKVSGHANASRNKGEDFPVVMTESQIIRELIRNRRGLSSLHIAKSKFVANLEKEGLNELAELEKWEHAVNQKYELILSRKWSTNKKLQLSAVVHLYM
ncbi:hypothetical protein BUALT_Bualt10G0090100 [Buddleja alternifolia]|uniref:Uncharacterized protein n=1 Tax=Buddleja alternifolia TaxID=168488 RepID=A0AAV6WWF2_9LAMI|nr:hypothetical protein BUALT_Bualt10G0090100 [Buddleja alternifolia]